MRISDWSSDVCSSDLLTGWAEYSYKFSIGFVDVTFVVRVQRTIAKGGGSGENTMAEPMFADDEPEGEEVISNRGYALIETMAEIGRASCRERVWQSV